MAKKKYLPLYEKWMRAGKLTEDRSALCDKFAYGGYPEFDLMTPTSEDFHQLKLEGFTCYTWGSGDIRKEDEYQFFTFTPLRQNIVLLMAAMAGEL